MSHMSELSGEYEEWLRGLVEVDLWDDLNEWVVLCPACKNHAEIIDPDKGIFRCPVCGACNDEETLIEIAKKKYSVLDYQADLEACEADRKYQERKEGGF